SGLPMRRASSCAAATASCDFNVSLLKSIYLVPICGLFVTPLSRCLAPGRPEATIRGRPEPRLVRLPPALSPSQFRDGPWHRLALIDVSESAPSGVSTGRDLAGTAGARR